MKFLIKQISCIVFFLGVSVYTDSLAIEEKPIVILITSYNNERWVERNLQSVFVQKYDNYRVIYVDDCSTDKTFECASKQVEIHKQQHRFTIIHNDERRNAMANFYTAIHSCADNEIVVTLDGDDWLAHDQVLSKINEAYSHNDIWFTYGQYQCFPSGQPGDVNRSFPQYIVDNNMFRKYWYFPVSHLRTHYAWLFKLVALKDFLYDDYYYAMTSDKAMLAPMIEMASRGHFMQLHDVLYIYNTSNPISDGAVNVRLQTDLRDYILAQKEYGPLQAPQHVESFDEYDHTTVLMLIDEPSRSVSSALFKNIESLHAIYALVPQTCEGSVQMDATIQTLYYENNEFLKALSQCINNIDSRYILLVKASDYIECDVNLIDAMRLLKKTHTDLFYFSLAQSDVNAYKRSRLPKVDLIAPVYAWYSDNKTDTWTIPVFNMTLWNKALLQKALSVIGNMTDYTSVESSVAQWLEHAHTLGLMYTTTCVK
jgi:glycosyltransferase involved in cell wall biosynthesis